MSGISMTLLSLLLVTAPPARGERPLLATQAVVPNCQVFPLDDVDVPALEEGTLTAVHVKGGVRVQAGQLLAQIDDRQAQLQKESAELQMQAAKARAEDDIEVRYALKSFELAKAEFQQDEEINRNSPGAVPRYEVRRKELAVHRAELQIDRSRLDRKVAQMTADVQNAEVRAAEESIARRQIVAPFDGTVIEVYREAAEWVNAGEAVLRVVRVDRLRVDGFVNASQFNPMDVAGRKVTIAIELARGRQERFEGQIVFVNPVVQVGNNYRVSAEVQNREEEGEPLLRPGMTVTMVIHH